MISNRQQQAKRFSRGLFKALMLGTLVLVSLESALEQGAKAQLIGNLTVEVAGLQNQDGNICLKLFSGSRGFPNDNDSAVQRTCVAITPEGEPQRIASATAEDPDAPFRYTFENLPLGTYGVAIYHDRNGDAQLNRNSFGAPLEGYGFSNDAPADTGPARFGDAIFLVAGAETTIQIQMRYPN